MKAGKFVVSLAAVMCWTGSAHAGQVINVDFQPGPSGDVYSVTHDGVGAYPDAGTTWNTVAPDTDATGNGAFGSGGAMNFLTDPFIVGSLVDSTGTVTGVGVEVFRGDPDYSFALNPANGGDVNIADDAKDLMRDYLVSTGPNNPSAVNITGLTPFGIYTLYLYGAADNGAGTTFIVNSIGKSTAGIPGGSHNLTEGQDYVTFVGVVADAGGLISVLYRNNDESADGNFNGFQLIEASPVEINTVSVSSVTGLSFASETDAVYRLQYTSDLLATNWITAPVIYIGTGGQLAAFDPNGFSTQRMYRVAQQ